MSQNVCCLSTEHRKHYTIIILPVYIIIRVTLNNASDYRTNGLYRTLTVTLTLTLTLVRYSVSPLARQSEALLSVTTLLSSGFALAPPLHPYSSEVPLNL